MPMNQGIPDAKPQSALYSDERAVVLDIGGVLLSNGLPAVARAWSDRLGIGEQGFYEAVFGGSDQTILIGRVGEPEWLDVVAGRLGIGRELTARLRGDVAAAGEWDEKLVAFVRDLPVRTAIISNAWPHMRARLAGVRLDVDVLALSCEVGCAKPDPRIFLMTIEQLGVAPEAALFVDDVPAAIQAAEAAGLTGRLHLTSADTMAAIGRFIQAGQRHDASGGFPVYD